MARKYCESLIRQVVRPLFVSTLSLAACIIFRQLGPGSIFLHDISSWNLLTGLSFGLLLRHGSLYAPVIFLTYAIVPVWPNLAGIVQCQALFPALTATSTYVFASEGIRK